ncbi:MAG: SIR2 family protein [Planctomycetota bacterium]
MSTSDRAPQEWAENGLLEEFSRMDGTMPDRQFCFFLGSGASVTSGIPAGGKLAYDWLKDIYHLKHGIDAEDDETLKAWATADTLGIKDFEYHRAAEFYSLLYERRFQHDPKSAYPYLEDLMDGQEPGFGYSVLAQLLTREKTPHKVVITTNFDNLVSDALAFYTQTAPLVCGHESLAGFAGTRLRRPLIAKIHGDLFLNPRNAQEEIDQLHESWQASLRKLFRQYTPIFIGYGGNDPSVMNFLASLDAGEIEGGVYWVYRRGHPPPQAARNLIVKHGGALVASTGFDEFMFLLHQKLKLPYLADEVKGHADQRARHYQDQVDALVKSVSRSPADEQTSEKAAVRRITETPETWWQWELKVEAAADPNEQEQIYRQAIAALPESHELMSNFAFFLSEVRREHDEAESFYRKAIQTEPEDARLLNNLANLLRYSPEQLDEAKELYQKAVRVNPENVSYLGNYATYLWTISGDYDEAEKLYRKSLGINSKHATNLGNLANFYNIIREKYDEAEKFYRKSLEIDPEHTFNLANFAGFLLGQKRWQEAAVRITEAWQAATKPSQVAGSILVYRLLLNAVHGQGPSDALGRLKTILSGFINRDWWSFAPMFDAVTDQIDGDDLAFYRAVADGVLDEEKAKALAEMPRWRAIEPIPLDAPWPEG